MVHVVSRGDPTRASSNGVVEVRSTHTPSEQAAVARLATSYFNVLRVALRHDFQAFCLEVFMPLLLPFEILDDCLHGLLMVNPYVVKTQERRSAVMTAITMPDVLLEHHLVPELTPFCSRKSSATPIARFSSHTLYLLLMAFSRPVPDHEKEVEEVERTLKQFNQVLEQFRSCLQVGDPEDNLGGVRVLCDVLWKLFTRRQTVISPERHFNLVADAGAGDEGGGNADTRKADNYYSVKYVQQIVDLLVDLQISHENRAVPIYQDFVTSELLVQSEANVVRRRPEPENKDNVCKPLN